MIIKRGGLYLSDLNPRRGAEAGKMRPVLVVQTDLLNDDHPSTIVCPITTNVKKESTILRVHLSAHESGLKERSDIIVDQIRSVDNRRLIKRIGELSSRNQERLLQNIRILLFE